MYDEELIALITLIDNEVFAGACSLEEVKKRWEVLKYELQLRGIEGVKYKLRI